MNKNGQRKSDLLLFGDAFHFSLSSSSAKKYPELQIRRANR